MAFNQVQGIDYNLAGSGIDDTQVSIDVIPFTFPNGDLITTADIGVIGYATIEPETALEENISFTTITQNADGSATLSGVTRGLKFDAPYTTDANLRQPHAGGVIIRLTNSAPFYNEFAIKRNNEDITGQWTFTTANRPDLTSDIDATVDTQLITHGELIRAVLGNVSVAYLLSTGVAGEALAIGDWVYFKESDARWYKTDADAASTSLNLKLGNAQTVAAGAASTFNVATGGSIPNLTGLSAGSRYYLSGTAGAITTTPGTESVFVGWALSTTSLMLGVGELPDNIITGTSGEALTAGNWVYFNTSTSKWSRTDADAAATATGVQIGVVQNTVAATDLVILVRIAGVDSLQTSLTGGTKYFLSGTIGTIGSTQGTFPRYVGTALGTQRILLANSTDLFNVEQHAQQISGTTGGSSTVYTLGLNPALPALFNGFHAFVKLHTATGASPTLNVDTIGAVSMVKGLSTAIIANDYATNQVIEVVYNSTGPVFHIIPPPNALVTGVDGGDQHFHQKRSVILTRDLSAASGAVSTAHGLGRIPKFTELVGLCITNGNQELARSDGSYDGTTNRHIHSWLAAANSLTGGDSTNGIVFSAASANAANQSGVVTVDATNVTITWTKTGSPTGIANIMITVE